MGRSHCCSKEGLNRGTWTAHEDRVLREYIRVHGEGRWRNLPQRAGLKRCGKSCRLRWLNYLRPNIKRGNITPDEEDLIIRLHSLLGNRWSLIAGRLPGRTDNEIKNYWNTNLGKKVKDGKQSSGEGSNGNAKKRENPMPHSPSHVDVVRIKATKLLFLKNPPPHPSISMQSQNKSNKPKAQQEEEEEVMLNVADSVISNQMEPTTTYDNGFLSFMDEDKELPLSTDLLIDFNIGDIYLSDLLNSDFSCTNNILNNHDHSCSDQPHPMFSDELLKDSTHNTCFADEADASNDLHSFFSFLESTEEND